MRFSSRFSEAPGSLQNGRGRGGPLSGAVL